MPYPIEKIEKVPTEKSERNLASPKVNPQYNREKKHNVTSQAENRLITTEISIRLCFVIA